MLNRNSSTFNKNEIYNQKDSIEHSDTVLSNYSDQNYQDDSMIKDVKSGTSLKVNRRDKKGKNNIN